MIKYDKFILVRNECVFMEFKRCARCGCFFTSANDVCCNCETKDRQDIYNLNNYIVTSPNNISIDNLSASTGISMKNISRFIENKAISNL